ncbi:hypothetical protein SOCE26_098060 [Sorangium cellulosum]|uniref:UPF0235 protein SOCE26_098060 n=1 Tax=Sorangium cellulosum TaxID=56 RepID=A0A2L0F9M5_SORCE|nr:DUF167 domain-containing protein [Sorangium cellulosum]AUX48274.1 hypothetical protein SOCE26_098060 [Sorangium cellulosum]
MSKPEESAIDGAWSRLAITERAEGVRISVQVRPRSSRSTILGVREAALDVALTSPPVDGAANAELVQLLARALDVRRSDVEITLGTSGRSKVVAVRGLKEAETRRRLAGAHR